MNVEFFRSITRPGLTWLISMCYVWAWLHPERFSADHIAIMKPSVLIVLGFWFGPRALKASGLLDRKKDNN